MSRIFVSHSHQNNDFCRDFVNTLREIGLDVWYDEHRLGAGAIRQVIEREMAQCDQFIVIMSPSAVTSDWVNAEIDAALDLLRAGVMKSFLPVMAETCKMPLLLERYKRIDAGLTANEAARRAYHALFSLGTFAYPPLPQTSTITTSNVAHVDTAMSTMLLDDDNIPRQIQNHPTLFIAISTSGSMFGEPLRAITEAVCVFVADIRIPIDIAILAVADNVIVVQPPTNQKDQVIQALQSHIRPGIAGFGYSAHPFNALCNLSQGVSGRKFALVFNDGYWSNEAKALRSAELCHNLGIHIIFVDIGDADLGFAQAMQKIGHESFYTSYKDLKLILDKVNRILES